MVLPAQNGDLRVGILCYCDELFFAADRQDRRPLVDQLLAPQGLQSAIDMHDAQAKAICQDLLGKWKLEARPIGKAGGVAA